MLIAVIVLVSLLEQRYKSRKKNASSYKANTVRWSSGSNFFSQLQTQTKLKPTPHCLNTIQMVTTQQKEKYEATMATVFSLKDREPLWLFVLLFATIDIFSTHYIFVLTKGTR